jgi:hypothetical protein
MDETPARRAGRSKYDAMGARQRAALQECPLRQLDPALHESQPGRINLALLLVVLVLLATGCAGGAPAAWLPGAGDARHRVVVSIDTLHAMIGLPPEDGGPGLEEWGYAERGWYLEGRQGSGGAVRALLWPTAGVVEVARAARPWAERTPDPPAETFVLEVGAEALARLRAHLRATLVSAEPVAHTGTSRFYPARRAYHLFHHCHHYAAAALRAAGLPVSPAAAWTRDMLADQLRAFALGERGG